MHHALNTLIMPRSLLSSVSPSLFLLALSLQFVSGTQAYYYHDERYYSDEERKRRAIIGAVIAGVTLICIIIAFFVYMWRKKKARQRAWTNLEPAYPATFQGGPAATYPAYAAPAAPYAYGQPYGQPHFQGPPEPAYMSGRDDTMPQAPFAYQPPPPPQHV
ncbi:hypothetical protein DFH09DRAFT_1362044 [Mycena vulgaris]|nr:hypothetical protein DFH09DRAFT_1362044 [Mycena vulgaris]